MALLVLVQQFQCFKINVFFFDYIDLTIVPTIMTILEMFREMLSSSSFSR